MKTHPYPLPPHFDPQTVGEVWRVPYQERAAEAFQWSQAHSIEPAAKDTFRLGLMLIDVQNTFCIPGFELYVGGRSGSGAVDDNRRLCAFIYRNLGTLTEISATLDTHDPFQIFHPIFFSDQAGNHPDPHTQITAEEVRSGRWQFNPALAETLGISWEYGQSHIRHYTAALEARHKYDLTIWPYHAIQGGIGHALVSAVEEAAFFHSLCRHTRVDFLVKGDHPFTEHYSALGPEIRTGPGGEKLTPGDSRLIPKLEKLDALVIAGQAKSHCVAWTIHDLLEDLRHQSPDLVERVYLLEDCTSPVVVPGVVDYTGPADAAFQAFAQAGMHIVRSTDALTTWPGNPSGKQNR
ncbi:MAG: hypothetical protein MUO62_03565 [Anaerolineales bacterium]|nr:hypothetical protein [Anaerolineales bacterium]